MYNVLDVARYIIWYCKKKGYSISNLKLQKILYFVQAEFLVSVGSPCFAEEIEAWDFGPVVPEVYHEFKIFGSADIPKFVCMNADEAILKKDKTMIPAPEICAFLHMWLIIRQEMSHASESHQKNYDILCSKG